MSISNADKAILIKMLNRNARDESMAASTYRQDAIVARNRDAYLTANLFEAIAKEEEHHLSELRAQLARIR